MRTLIAGLGPLFVTFIFSYSVDASPTETVLKNARLLWSRGQCSDAANILLASERAARDDTERAALLHERAIAQACLRTPVESFELFAQGFRLGDPAAPPSLDAAPHITALRTCARTFSQAGLLDASIEAMLLSTVSPGAVGTVSDRVWSALLSEEGWTCPIGTSVPRAATSVVAPPGTPPNQAVVSDELPSGDVAVIAPPVSKPLMDASSCVPVYLVALGTGAFIAGVGVSTYFGVATGDYTKARDDEIAKAAGADMSRIDEIRRLDSQVRAGALKANIGWLAAAVGGLSVTVGLILLSTESGQVQLGTSGSSVSVRGQF